MKRYAVLFAVIAVMMGTVARAQPPTIQYYYYWLPIPNDPQHCEEYIKETYSCVYELVDGDYLEVCTLINSEVLDVRCPFN